MRVISAAATAEHVYVRVAPVQIAMPSGQIRRVAFVEVAKLTELPVGQG